VKFNSWAVLGVAASALGLACSSVGGVLGPTGYEQALVKYKLGYSDPAAKKFLPDEWALDNYAYNATKRTWSEKKGDEYQAERWLDEDGDGTVSPAERTPESVFDLRFVNAHDNAVIWLKVHPLAFSESKRDLEVVLENYADGLAGTGLFEQSSLFNLKHDKARQYTTFIVSKESTTIGALAAIKGVIEIADVERLRLDPTHRDSKAALVFAHVKYRKPVSPRGRGTSLWPTTSEGLRTFEERIGLLVMGYYDDATRFDSHLADFQALQSRLVVPAEAVPESNALPVLPPPAAAPAPAAPPPATSTPGAPPASSAPAPDGSVGSGASTLSASMKK
jgi:hypothetical protein